MATEIFVKNGAETTEYKLAYWVNLVGVLITALGAGLEVVAQAGYGEHFVGIAVMVVGVVTKIINALGYGAKRTALKAKAVQAAENVGLEEAKSIKDVPAALAALRVAKEDAEVAEDLERAIAVSGPAPSHKEKA